MGGNDAAPQPTETVIRMTLWHGGKGLLAGLTVEGAGQVAGDSHSILVAIIAAISLVAATVLGPIVKGWWEIRHGTDPEIRLLKEIERKDRRIASLEAELDRERQRDETTH